MDTVNLESLNLSTRIKSYLLTILEALKDEATIRAVYLFGSYAYGTPTDESDLDIAVISECEDEDEESVRLLMKFSRQIPHSLDFLVFSEQQFKEDYEAGDFLVQNIFTKGVRIG